MKTTPLSLGNMILLKEKRGVRESIARQDDKQFGVSKERGAWCSRGGDRSLELSRRRKDKLFFFLLYIP